MKPVVVVQHAEAEGPYAIADAFRAEAAPMEVVRCHLGEPPPTSADGFSALVVMGGPMAAYDDAGFPTRRHELALLGEALAVGLPVLGVCLGAQLLAAAAGGRVRPGNGLEVGWAQVDLTDEAARDPLFGGLEGPLEVLHWHGDTFDLPAGVVHLASSTRYANQAFRVGPVAWGLQFHLEVTPAAVDAFLSAMPDDAAAASGGVVGLRSGARPTRAGLRSLQRSVLSRFAALALSSPDDLGAPSTP